MTMNGSARPWRRCFPIVILRRRSLPTGRKRWSGSATFNADVIVADLVMPRMDGFELLRHLKERGDLTPAIALTGFGSMEKALSAVHDLKAFWFLEKPVEPRAFKILLERAIRLQKESAEDRRAEARPEPSRRTRRPGGNFAGDAADLLAHQAGGAHFSARIDLWREWHRERNWLRGRSISAARAAMGLSSRSTAAALPETLIESELFGHEKGAFTGAMERSAGCFEQAHGGTLFLDEIGEMPLSTQPKLLRVLEDLRVRRLGGKHEIAVDARVLAATSQELGTHLREELYYRLSVFQIVVPPLREHKEDIPPIADVMLQNLNKKYGTRVTGVDAEVLDLFHRYDWPGNVRELRNILERATIMAGEGLIRLTRPSFPCVRCKLRPVLPGRSPGDEGPDDASAWPATHENRGGLHPTHPRSRARQSQTRRRDVGD